MGSDPPSNSLFDIENLQTLVSLGKSTTNILTNTTAVYGSDFTLGDEWFILTTRLGLDSVMQTYFIWLWLETAYTQTFSRVQNKGNS